MAKIRKIAKVSPAKVSTIKVMTSHFPHSLVLFDAVSVIDTLIVETFASECNFAIKRAIFMEKT